MGDRLGRRTGGCVLYAVRPMRAGSTRGRGDVGDG